MRVTDPIRIQIMIGAIFLSALCFFGLCTALQAGFGYLIGYRMEVVSRAFETRVGIALRVEAITTTCPGARQELLSTIFPACDRRLQSCPE